MSRVGSQELLGCLELIPFGLPLPPMIAHELQEPRSDKLGPPIEEILAVVTHNQAL